MKIPLKHNLPQVGVTIRLRMTATGMNIRVIQYCFGSKLLEVKFDQSLDKLKTKLELY